MNQIRIQTEYTDTALALVALFLDYPLLGSGVRFSYPTVTTAQATGD